MGKVTPDDMQNSGIGNEPGLLGGLYYNAGTGKYEIHPVEVVNGAAKVTESGVVGAAAGTMKTWSLDITAADVTDKATDEAASRFCWIVEAGFKGFSVDLIGSLAAGESVIVGWSHLPNDEATVAGFINALRATVASPDGTSVANAIVIGPNTPPPSILWDGVSTIKTIGICAGTIGAATVAAVKTVE